MRCAVLLVTIVIFSGCARVHERKAIDRYARAIVETNRQARALRLLHREFRRVLTRDALTVSRFVDARLLPLWPTYLKQLQAVPCETTAIKKQHLLIVEAHKSQLLALKSFRNGLSSSNLKARVRIYLAASEKSRELERGYHKQMLAYFKRHGVELEPARK